MESDWRRLGISAISAVWKYNLCFGCLSGHSEMADEQRNISGGYSFSGYYLDFQRILRFRKLLEGPIYGKECTYYFGKTGKAVGT